MSLIYCAETNRIAEWRKAFEQRSVELQTYEWPATGPVDDVQYIATWSNDPLQQIERFPNLKVIFSLGAGVDQFDLNSLPESVKLVRMTEPGIVRTMQDYVLMMTLALHRNLIDYIDQQRRKDQQVINVSTTNHSTIGVMGLGRLGKAVAQRLRDSGFEVRGWNRSHTTIESVSVFSGTESLRPFLSNCQILICMLPLTADTRGILNHRLFNALPKGASLLNVGRGAHLIEADLLKALDSGHLNSAILDVQSQEPLPDDHPFWDHPRILLTPHIASQTQPVSGVEQIVNNIHHYQQNEEMSGTVDRYRGY